jgi:hypothetical protein
MHAAGVFREGAENSARGGRAPLSLSEFGLHPPTYREAPPIHGLPMVSALNGPATSDFGLLVFDFPAGSPDWGIAEKRQRATLFAQPQISIVRRAFGCAVAACAFGEPKSLTTKTDQP